MMLGPIKGDYASAYEFGLLALHLNERLPDAGFRAKVLMNFSWAISIWRKPFADSFPYIRETVQLVNQTGVFSEAGYALFNAVYLTILSHHDLAAVKPACDENVAFLKRVKMEAFEDAPRVILQWARALQGYTERATSLTGDGFDETAYCRTHKNQGLFEMLYLVPKLMLFYSFEDYQAATEILGELDRVLRDAEDDRNRRGGSFGREGTIAEAGCSDHGHTTADELSHERRQAVVLAVQPVVLDHHVLALDVAGFVEGFTERSDNAHRGLGRSAADEADDRHCRLLRARRERPREHRTAQQRDELATLKLIKLHPLPLALLWQISAL